MSYSNIEYNKNELRGLQHALEYVLNLEYEPEKEKYRERLERLLKLVKNAKYKNHRVRISDYMVI